MDEMGLDYQEPEVLGWMIMLLKNKNMIPQTKPQIYTRIYLQKKHSSHLLLNRNRLRLFRP